MAGRARMAADWSKAVDGPPPPKDEPEQPAADEPEQPAADEPEQPAADEPEQPAAGGNGGRPVALAQDGAGWVLGLLLWAWVGMPFIKGGPSQVKAVLMAKFFNKSPDGTELP